MKSNYKVVVVFPLLLALVAAIWMLSGSSLQAQTFDDTLLETKEEKGRFPPPVDGEVTHSPTAVTAAAPGGISSNLALWLKADAGVTESGGSISQWSDQSVNAHQAVQVTAVNQPTLISNDINFNPTASFDGTNDFMTISGGILGTSSYNDLNVYLVHETNFVKESYVFYEAADPNRISMHLPFVDHTVYFDAGGTAVSRLTAGWSGQVDVPDLWSFLYGVGSTAVGNKQDIIRNGIIQSSDATSGVLTGIASDFYLGVDNVKIRYESADTAEMLIYTGALSAADHAQIQSYLATKYGITLGTAVSPMDYVNSAGTTTWTGSATYQNDVAGIARDNDSTLDQPQSRSINSDALVTVNSGGTLGVDLSALLWGNNNGTTALDQTAGIYQHMARVWTVAETGTVGSVNVSIPDSIAANYLLVDSDTDFSSGATAYLLTTDGNGNITTNVDFTDGQYFTFSTAPDGLGNALDFDGIDDYVIIDTAADDMVGHDANYTIESWFRLETVGSSQVILAANTSANGDKMSLFVNAAGNIVYEDAAGASIIGPVVSVNTWYHAAYVRDGASGILYINGVNQGSAAAGIVFAAADKWSIGQEWDAASSKFWNGQIDEVRIWTYSRTQGQIQSTMFNELASSTPGLVARYKMEDGQATSAADTTLSDQTANANNGTLTNMNAAIAWAGHLWNPDDTASNGGLDVTHNTFSKDDNDHFTYMHDDGSGTVGTNLPVGTANRWSRIWITAVQDENSNGGTVDLVFDADFSGVTLSSSNSDDYQLLHRNGTSGSFVVLMTASAVNMVDHTVTFTGVDSSIFDHVTMGVRAAAASDNKGNALDFDGVDDYVALSGDFGTGWTEVTIEAWIRPETLTGIDAIISPTTLKFVHFQLGGGITLYGDGANSVDLGIVSVPNNEWHHVAASFSSGNSRLYLDGVLISTSASTYGSIAPTSALHIGNGYNNGRFFDGHIDEVRIWNTARSQAQIQSNMYTEPTGSETGLAAYYRGEDADATSAADTTLTDISGNSHTGTLTNMDAATDWTGRMWRPDAVASNGGLTMTDNSFLNDNGDDILFAHNGLAGNTTAGTGFATLYPSGQRWERVWTCNVNDAAGTTGGLIDIVFDFAKAGMGNNPAPTNTFAHYKLVHVDNDGAWTEKVGAATSVDTINRTITFTGVDTDGLCSGITLATDDAVGSPTAVSLQSITASNKTAVLPIILITTLFLLFAGSVALRQRS